MVLSIFLTWWPLTSSWGEAVREGRPAGESSPPSPPSPPPSSLPCLGSASGRGWWCCHRPGQDQDDIMQQDGLINNDQTSIQKQGGKNVWWCWSKMTMAMIVTPTFLRLWTPAIPVLLDSGATMGPPQRPAPVEIVLINIWTCSTSRYHDSAISKKTRIINIKPIPFFCLSLRFCITLSGLFKMFDSLKERVRASQDDKSLVQFYL